jgi:hypothetical protein
MAANAGSYPGHGYVRAFARQRFGNRPAQPATTA